MKTVYILGTGFSMDAGAPSQAAIMSKAFENYKENPANFDSDHFKRFKNFLTKSMYLLPNQFDSLALEDIFTPLDRCLAENAQFRGLDVAEIIKVRESVFHIVATTIKLELDKTQNNKSYIEKFAKYLVTESKARKNQEFRDNDPVSVISTNWDLLLDNALYDVIARDHLNKAVVD